MSNISPPEVRSRCSQQNEYHYEQVAIILPSFAVIMCCGLLACGCGSKTELVTNSSRLGTNQIGLVSIGVINTVDTQRQEAIMRFFATNGVECSIEGSLMYDIMVRQKDVERAHAILKTNRVAETAFRSAWE